MQRLNKKPRRIALTLVAAATLAMSPHAASAQGFGDPGNVAPNLEIALDDGFPVRDFVKYVKERAIDQGSPINVMYTEDAGAYELPAVHLTDVSPAAALRALMYITNDALHVVEEELDEGYSVWSISVFDSEALVKKSSRVVSLGFLANGEADDEKANPFTNFVSAVDAALEFRNSETRPEIRIHPQTALLFVTGTQEDHVFIDELIGAMSAAQAAKNDQRESTAMAKAKKEAELFRREYLSIRDQLEDYKQQVGEMRSRLAELEIELAKARALGYDPAGYKTN